ncbi:MAG: protein phosphatase 2C domain-containing protein [archaeon]|nr:protein phosphatase 2C domain-containing protein [archaeon]
MNPVQLRLDFPHEGHDEDAPAFLNERCAVVCDGMGSGSKQFTVGEETRSHAWFASRNVSRTVSAYLTEHWAGFLENDHADINRLVNGLKREICENLQAFSRENNVDFEGMSISGTILKLLPTTLSAFAYRENEADVDVVCIWAGDSRCFCEDATGLHQLTVDDAEGCKDAMDDYLMDSAMSNIISLSKDFHLNWRVFRLAKPCVLFTASDGVFAYLESPMQFESALLPKGEGDFDFVSNLMLSLSANHHDDCSLAGCMFGYEDQNQYAAMMGGRAASLRESILTRLDGKNRVIAKKAELKALEAQEMTSEIKKARLALKNEIREISREFGEERTRFWEDYKKDYSPEPMAVTSAPVPESEIYQLVPYVPGRSVEPLAEDSAEPEHQPEAAEVREQRPADAPEPAPAPVARDVSVIAESFAPYAHLSRGLGMRADGWHPVGRTMCLDLTSERSEIVFATPTNLGRFYDMKSLEKELLSTEDFVTPIRFDFDKATGLAYQVFKNNRDYVSFTELQSAKPNMVLDMFNNLARLILRINSKGFRHNNLNTRSVAIVRDGGFISRSYRAIIRDHLAVEKAEVFREDCVGFARLLVAAMSGTEDPGVDLVDLRERTCHNSDRRSITCTALVDLASDVLAKESICTMNVIAMRMEEIRARYANSPEPAPVPVPAEPEPEPCDRWNEINTINNLSGGWRRVSEWTIINDIARCRMQKGASRGVAYAVYRPDEKKLVTLKDVRDRLGGNLLGRNTNEYRLKDYYIQVSQTDVQAVDPVSLTDRMIRFHMMSSLIHKVNELFSFRILVSIDDGAFVFNRNGTVTLVNLVGSRRSPSHDESAEAVLGLGRLLCEIYSGRKLSLEEARVFTMQDLEPGVDRDVLGLLREMLHEQPNMRPGIGDVAVRFREYVKRLPGL